MARWRKAALEALAAALALGGEVTVGLVGAATQAAADQIAGCGAARFLAVTGEAFAQARYATDAAAAEALCRASRARRRDRAGHVAVGAGAAGRGVPARRARGYARHRDRACAMSVPAVTRWFYRQRMEAVLTRSQRPWIVLLDAGCVAPWTGAAGVGDVEAVPVEVPATRTTVTGDPGAASGRADHPARRQTAVRGGRRLDQEAGRRRGARGGGGGADPGIPARGAGVAGRQQDRWWI